uniref:Uncharacterized protein n=1 Tax=Dromaius novaehollandiae TaxID=8790 RepID=A0A8C4KM53_DRONO
MIFSGKYGSSPIASANLVLKYTVFVNKFTLSTHDLDVIASCISYGQKMNSREVWCPGKERFIPFSLQPSVAEYYY